MAKDKDPFDEFELGPGERDFFADPPVSPGSLAGRRRLLGLDRVYMERQGVLGLQLDYVDETRNLKTYKASPSVLFKPQGFMVWGVDNHTMITSLVLSNEESLFSADPVPARFFATAVSYEELQVMAKENKITLPTWCNFPALTPATCVRVGVIGNIDNLCLWGIGQYR